jgi:class 3 adenylate cyclase
MDQPVTQYATVGESQVAYQVVGDGPQDLLFCYSLGGSVDLVWQVPSYPRFIAQLTGTHRVITFDRRGSGSSDPLPLNAIPTWEEQAEDITAVLDAAESQQTAVMGILDTGPLGILFAAMHPERVSHLILISTTPRFAAADDYPIGVSPDVIDGMVEFMASTWGGPDLLPVIMPSAADDTEELTAWSRMFRASATPRSAATQYENLWRHMDVREFLPIVQAPTLVCHPTDNALLPLDHGRYLADHLPDGRLIEWPGGDMVPSVRPDSAPDIIEFLTGERPMEAEVERLLTTVLFTDIVGSTERAANEGDHRWGQILAAHHKVVRAELRRYRGVEIDTAGDGFFATFDGPARAVRCACAIRDGVKAAGVEIRAGLHTGEVEVFDDTLRGMAVHIGARVGSTATASEVLVSRTVADLVVGSGIEFTDRGDHELKGVPGSWQLFAVKS